jgi:hypothetical protein
MELDPKAGHRAEGRGTVPERDHVAPVDVALLGPASQLCERRLGSSRLGRYDIDHHVRDGRATLCVPVDQQRARALGPAHDVEPEVHARQGGVHAYGPALVLDKARPRRRAA